MGRGIYAYTYDKWARIEADMRAMEEKSEEMQRFFRTFIGGAFDCACDKQERILIPAILREQAELDKEIVLVGVLERFEVWSRENWELEIKQQEQDAKREDVRREIARIGL